MMDKKEWESMVAELDSLRKQFNEAMVKAMNSMEAAKKPTEDKK